MKFTRSPFLPPPPPPIRLYDSPIIFPHQQLIGNFLEFPSSLYSVGEWFPLCFPENYMISPRILPPPGDGKNSSLIQKSRAFKSSFSYYRMCTVLKILKARFKCCVANCNFSVFPNPSAPPASCPEVALPDSQDNLEVTSEVSEGCVDICCGCDSRYKWYDEEGKGILSRGGPCCE